ncbi:DUF4129 domain-containing protein [Arthrobacter sp. Hiyo1]|uniref:DUF4129 domain-containing protein n=1 Tax=Arthrobacter sp. Hiyo1 TaxID=1588020 RepID=UPI00209BE733|nr:DUF4129 domain-containing protein [Arthrobacter sp. Hiyo1]
MESVRRLAPFLERRFHGWGKYRRAADRRPGRGPHCGCRDGRQAEAQRAEEASAKVFDGEPTVDADTFRARASAAASREDWQTAVVEQFRAVVRSAEDRAVIDVQAGRTADEAAAQLGRAFGDASSRLEEAARIFDGVKYGKATATASDHAAVLSLDTGLSAMKPDFAGQSANGLACRDDIGHSRSPVVRATAGLVAPPYGLDHHRGHRGGTRICHCVPVPDEHGHGTPLRPQCRS